MFLLLQLRTTAYNNMNPNQVTTADVVIIVQRNAHAPQFSQPQYQVQVDDTTALGQTIFTVNATDSDGVGN